MSYSDPYRDPAAARRLCDALARAVRGRWCLMEVCGGQTHTIVKYGLDRLLPPGIELLHGPGCPVCVTGLEVIDRAHALVERRDVVLCSFGDMLRVPGSRTDLLRAKAAGADVRVVYSPLDALEIARANPDRQVVFFAIGFETTAPANAMAIRMARARKVTNFSALVSHVLVPPALTAILEAPGNRVQAFLGPGHVCTVMGTAEYEAVSRQHRVPIVITGFEPVDLLEGVLRAVLQLEAGEGRVENQYARVVREPGNEAARAVIAEVFEVCDRAWRGVGLLPRSGLRLREAYADMDAERRFELGGIVSREPAACLSGQILRGLLRPPDCPAFGRSCTPLTPLGATMVSSEGACAAYYQYGRQMAASSKQDSP